MESTTKDSTLTASGAQEDASLKTLHTNLGSRYIKLSVLGGGRRRLGPGRPGGLALQAKPGDLVAEVDGRQQLALR